MSKRKILFCFVFIFIVGCARIQLVELKTDNAALKDNFYVFEDFRMSIYYNFWAESGKVSFYVFNKLEHPLYIDWEKSFFKINDNKYYYWKTQDNQINNPAMQSTNQVIKKISYIPAKSFIKNIDMDIPLLKESVLLKDFERIEASKIFLGKKNEGDVLKKKFTDRTSDERFNNFLVFYITKKNDNKIYKEFNIVNFFWIDTVTLLSHEQFFFNDELKTYNLSPYFSANSFFINLPKK